MSGVGCDLGIQFAGHSYHGFHAKMLILSFIYKYIWLVVLTILKNMKVNGKDYPIYYGKKKMFETTNQ